MDLEQQLQRLQRFNPMLQILLLEQNGYKAMYVVPGTVKNINKVRHKPDEMMPAVLRTKAVSA